MRLDKAKGAPKEKYKTTANGFSCDTSATIDKTVRAKHVTYWQSQPSMLTPSQLLEIRLQAAIEGVPESAIHNLINKAYAETQASKSMQKLKCISALTNKVHPKNTSTPAPRPVCQNDLFRLSSAERLTRFQSKLKRAQRLAKALNEKSRNQEPTTNTRISEILKSRTGSREDYINGTEDLEPGQIEGRYGRFKELEENVADKPARTDVSIANHESKKEVRNQTPPLPMCVTDRSSREVTSKLGKSSGAKWGNSAFTLRNEFLKARPAAKHLEAVILDIDDDVTNMSTSVHRDLLKEDIRRCSMHLKNVTNSNVHDVIADVQNNLKEHRRMSSCQATDQLPLPQLCTLQKGLPSMPPVASEATVIRPFELQALPPELSRLMRPKLKEAYSCSMEPTRNFTRRVLSQSTLDRRPRSTPPAPSDAEVKRSLSAQHNQCEYHSLDAITASVKTTSDLLRRHRAHSASMSDSDLNIVFCGKRPERSRATLNLCRQQQRRQQHQHQQQQWKQRALVARRGSASGQLGREGTLEGADKPEMLQAGIRMMPRLMRSVPELRLLPAVGENPYSKCKPTSLVGAQNSAISSETQRILAQNLHIGAYRRPVNV